MLWFFASGFIQNEKESVGIPDEDLVLSSLSPFLRVASFQEINKIIENLIFSSQAELLADKNIFIDAINEISFYPASFSSYKNFSKVLEKKFIEEYGHSPLSAKKFIEKIITKKNIEFLVEGLKQAIWNMKVKEEYSLKKIIIQKGEKKRILNFRDFSGNNVNQKKAIKAISKVTLPESVKNIEIISSNEMIPPATLTDKGKTILIREDASDEQIKAVMIIRNLNRKTVAEAARRKLRYYQESWIEFEGKKLVFANLTDNKKDISFIGKILKRIIFSETVKKIEVIPREKVGSPPLRLTDKGETLLLAGDILMEEVADGFLMESRERADISEMLSQKIMHLPIDENLSTIPSMISGIDIKEVFESLVKEFSLMRYSAEIRALAEKASISIIQISTTPSFFATPLYFKAALIEEGFLKEEADELADAETIKRIAEIIQKIKATTLAIAGKKIVVSIGKREIPLLTIGKQEKYSPRKIRKVETQLIPYQQILSIVDEIIIVGAIQRDNGYTLRQAEKIKAYVSYQIMNDNEEDLEIKWMPTLGQKDQLTEIIVPHVVFSTIFPSIKIISMEERVFAQAESQLEKEEGIKIYWTKENGDFYYREKEKEDIRVSLEELKKESFLKEILFFVPDSIYSSLSYETVSWLYGDVFAAQSYSLSRAGIFKGDKNIIYDFTKIASEFDAPLHQPLMEQNVGIIQEEIMTSHNASIVGVRVVPAEEFSLKKMEAKLRRLPSALDSLGKGEKEYLVLDLGEGIALALIFGEISVEHLKKVLQGEKIKVISEKQRENQKQINLYQSKIKNGSKVSLFESDTIERKASQQEKEITDGLNKVFNKGTAWIEGMIEGRERLGEYLIYDTEKATYDFLSMKEENGQQEYLKIRLKTILNLYHDLQAKNSILFKK